MRCRAARVVSVVLGGPPVSPPSHGCSSLPLTCGSDDDRANLMWKRYLEREDSKIVGTEPGKATWANQRGGGVRAWEKD